MTTKRAALCQLCTKATSVVFGETSRATLGRVVRMYDTMRLLLAGLTVDVPVFSWLFILDDHLRYVF